LTGRVRMLPKKIESVTFASHKNDKEVKNET